MYKFRSWIQKSISFHSYTKFQIENCPDIKNNHFIFGRGKAEIPFSPSVFLQLLSESLLFNWARDLPFSLATQLYSFIHYHPKIWFYSIFFRSTHLKNRFKKVDSKISLCGPFILIHFYWYTIILDKQFTDVLL